MYTVYQPLHPWKEHMNSLRRRSLTAGLLYFSTHVTSVAAVVAYGTEPPDVSARLNQTPILIGVLLELALALGVIGTGVVLLPALRPHGASLAHTFSSLRNVEGAVIIAGSMAMLALVWTADAGVATVGLAEVLFNLHRASFLLGQGLVISVNSIVIGVLLRRSGLVPGWIGSLGVVGGGVVLASNLAQLFGAIDFGGTAAGVAAIPVFAFEICFAGFLTMKGLRSTGRPGARSAHATGTEDAWGGAHRRGEPADLG